MISAVDSSSFLSSSEAVASSGTMKMKCLSASPGTSGSRFSGYGITEKKAVGGMGAPEGPSPKPSKIWSKTESHVNVSVRCCSHDQRTAARLVKNMFFFSKILSKQEEQIP